MENVNEKAKSKAQQRLFGMVRAFQKGELKDASEKVKKIAKGISKKDARKFARTKHEDIKETSFIEYLSKLDS